MTYFGSLVGGAVAVLAVALTAGAVSVNLPTENRLILTAVLIGGAALIGMLVGGAIMRRAAQGMHHIRMFTTVAAGFGVGTIAALSVAAITASYLATYGHMPADIVGQIFFVLAVPAFALLGWFLGAILGAGIGLVTGTVLHGLGRLRR